MSDNTAQTLVFLGSVVAAVALIVTDHGEWVVSLLLLVLVFIGG